jgi:hypothetical protein
VDIERGGVVSGSYDQLSSLVFDKPGRRDGGTAAGFPASSRRLRVPWSSVLADSDPPTMPADL